MDTPVLFRSHGIRVVVLFLRLAKDRKWKLRNANSSPVAGYFI